MTLQYKYSINQLKNKLKTNQTYILNKKNYLNIVVNLIYICEVQIQ